MNTGSLRQKTTSFTAGLARPDQEAINAAMADFLKRLEAKEKRNYSGLDEVLSYLPVPKPVHFDCGRIKKLELCTWNVEESRKVIELLKQPDFNAANIDDDIPSHKRIS